jgi:F0F1-type ATP synthase beta subunit
MELSLQETPKQIFPQFDPLRFEKNQVNAIFVGEENHVQVVCDLSTNFNTPSDYLFTL